jgi:DNA-binding GntR family transcriptional regulator
MNLARTTAHALADSLRSEINGGHWPAGAALRQEDLAVRYGASRIPVREALGLLAAEGLITLEPNRGAYVATLDMAGVTEIFDLRQMLESSALRSAIPAHTPKTLAKLEAIQAQLAIEDEREGWLEGDRRFHDALYAPATSWSSRTLFAIRIGAMFAS